MPKDFTHNYSHSFERERTLADDIDEATTALAALDAINTILSGAIARAEAEDDDDTDQPELIDGLPEFPAGIKVSDISSEEERTYVYYREDGDVDEVTIFDPVRLHVRPSGEHIVQSQDGKTHYVQAGFVEIEALPRAGAPAFTV